MDYLLDTHAFLWYINGDAELSANAKNLMDDINTRKHISIVSFWEIAVKVSIGKLKLAMPFNELSQYALVNKFDILSITLEHTLALSDLYFHHKDPFDRMIIAQAISEKFTAISKDGNFPKYKSLQLIW